MKDMSSQEVIDLQKWWLGELQIITKKLMDQEEKRQAKSNAKRDKALEDYRNKDDILDAYGLGCITERQKDRLMDLWDQREQAAMPDKVYQNRIGLVQEYYQLAKDIIRNNGGEASEWTASS